MKNIPNLFTLLNLVFGCLAIVSVLQSNLATVSQETGQVVLFLPEMMWLASLFIGLAALVDFLDGFLARLFKASSEMGKQLDSLADVVSFGVAPGMILYQFLRLSVASQDEGLDASMIWLLPAFVLPAAAAWRLAKFNLDDTQTYFFKGVPTPAVGLVVASLPLIYWYNDTDTVMNLLLNKWFLYAVVLILSYLMVSNLPIMSLKFKDFTLKNNLPKLILVIVAVVAAILLQWLAIPVVFLFYIVLSLAFKNKIT